MVAQGRGARQGILEAAVLVHEIAPATGSHRGPVAKSRIIAAPGDRTAAVAGVVFLIVCGVVDLDIQRGFRRDAALSRVHHEAVTGIAPVIVAFGIGIVSRSRGSTRSNSGLRSSSCST